MLLVVDEDIKKEISTENFFQYFMSLRGQVYRELEGRCTQRIQYKNTYYFLKQHRGVGWLEIFKNLFQLRLPIVSAKNEWQAIQHLQQKNIPTLELIAYGRKGYNPAKMQSFLLTKELADKISLEDLTREWNINRPSFIFKNYLIKEVAKISRIMHESGMNHRDYYLCHFLIDKKDLKTLYLIDLHRSQLRQITPERWKIKDLAGLYFSSKALGLTSRDLLRFAREYRQLSLRTILTKERNFWKKVKKRGDKTYQRHG